MAFEDSSQLAQHVVVSSVIAGGNQAYPGSGSAVVDVPSLVPRQAAYKHGDDDVDFGIRDLKKMLLPYQ